MEKEKDASPSTREKNKRKHRGQTPQSSQTLQGLVSQNIKE
jgi:hypothetical protein